MVGETPNLAARLQALAAPGSVVISQATRRLVGGLFELADLGPRRLKGFAEPLAAWRVEGEGRAEGRFEALHGERLTPLVGREHELGILLSAGPGPRTATARWCCSSGEPGIGKSRLIRALRERLGDEPYTPLSHFCSPYHTNSALHPVIDLLERAARLDRDDAGGGAAGQARGGAGPVERPAGRGRAPARRPARGADRRALSGARPDPEVQKRRTFEALVDQLAGLAAQQPVLALYEDVHWIDPSTLELLGLVIERVQQLPRPGADHLPAGVPAALDRPRARHHADHEPSGPAPGGRSGGAGHGRQAAAGEVVEQIVARTDGVPLFVEELTKTVLEFGPAHRCRRPLRAVRPTPAARDPDDACTTR